MKAFKSELLKIKTLKSTYIVFGLSAFFLISFGGLLVFVAMNFTRDIPNNSVTSGALWGFANMGSSLAMMALTVFAILTITGEYTYSTLFTSLLATPKRYVLYIAKLVTVFVSTFGMYAVSLLITFPICFLFLGNKAEGSFFEMFSNSIVMGLLIPALGMALLCLIALGIGFIVKNSAAAICIFLGVFSLLSSIITVINQFAKFDWLARLISLLPDSLYQRLLNTDAVTAAATANTQAGAVQITADTIPVGDHTIAALTNFQAGLGLFLWTLLILAAGYVLFSKRDV